MIYGPSRSAPAIVALLGDGTAEQWRAAIVRAQSAMGGAFAARVQGTPPPDARRMLGVWSTYGSDDGDPREGADLVIEVTPNTREKRMTKTHEFLWLDLETAGLDPRTGRVLEFAAVLCEDARGDNLTVVAQYVGVIGASPDVLDSLEIDPAVMRMHAANGLWADVRANAASAAPTTIEDVDAFLAALADSLTGGLRHRVVLAGSSVHFDLAWCRVHFPRFAEYLSHRVLDVTTLRRAVDSWAPKPVAWPARGAHRALDDILASIGEARVARAAMFGGAL